MSKKAARISSADAVRSISGCPGAEEEGKVDLRGECRFSCRGAYI